MAYRLIILLIFLSATSTAHEPPQPIYSIYWSDGDSGWINGKKDGFAFRLNSIDAPETLRSKCEQEKRLGYEAKAWVVELTRDTSKLKISRYMGHDRYKRHIVDISVVGEDLGESGIVSGAYGSWRHKGTRALEPKPNWCN